MKRMNRWLGIMMSAMIVAGSLQAPVYAVEAGATATEAEVETDSIESVETAEGIEPDADFDKEEHVEEDSAVDVSKMEEDDIVGDIRIQPVDENPESSDDGNQDLSEDEIVEKVDSEQYTISEESSADADIIEEDLEESEASAATMAVVASGVCGDNLTYQITGEGSNLTLTISGIGEMYDYATFHPDQHTVYSVGDLPLWVSDVEIRKNINHIIVEEGVTGIGAGAFSYIGSPEYGVRARIEEICLPQTLQRIGGYAFYFTGCDEITIGSPNNPVRFEYPNPRTQQTLYGKGLALSNFRNVSICMDDTYGSSFDHSTVENVVLLEGTTTIPGGCFNDCEELQSVELAKTVTQIDDFAFSGCHSLIMVDIPNGSSLEIINKFAFENCYSLKTITLPEGLNTIKQDAFENCTSLDSIDIPNSVTTIEFSVFSGCTSLASVHLPEGLEIIDGLVFANCSNLTSISIPVSVTEIKDKAFYNCKNLTMIEIPAGVNAIAYEYSFKGGKLSAFAGADKLVEIKVSNGNTTYKSYDGCLYNSELTELLYCPEGKNKLTIAPSTTSIYAGALLVGDVSDSTLTSNIQEIHFGTSSPEIPDNTLRFLTATAYYNNLRNNWPADKRQNYGGTITWVEKPLNLSDCTVSISPSSYTYDGTAKKPTVTINYNGKTLTNNTDYTLSYSSNTNAGTGTVTATGKGYFTGTVSKTFTINKAAPTLTFASATVSKKTTDSAFTNTLTKKTDGAVTFKSSKTAVATVNSSTGLVTIKGEGTTTITATAAAGTNYNSGSASYTLKVTPVTSNTFKWNRDNWNFNNNSSDGFTSGRYISQINSSYLNTLKANLTNSEYEYIFDKDYGWIYDSWGGSCYGMSSLIHLSQNGLVPYSSYTSGATSLYNLVMPKNNMNVSSLITYYQMLQIKGVIQRQYRTVPSKSNRDNINAIIGLLNSNKTVLVGYQKAGWGGHAVIAYDVEYGSYTWNGVTYQGCLKICDPNSSRGYNNKYNIYFNSSSYNWAVPAYYSGGLISTKGAVFNYVGSNVSDTNAGGYLAGNNNVNNENYVARLDAFDISDDRNITKVKESNGNYNTVSGGGDDIVEDYSYMMSGSDDGVIGYNLFDANSAYKVTQNNADTLKLRMDYEECLLSAESPAGNSAIFDKKGYVLMDCDSADYVIGITSNDDYPTDWFTVKVSGTGVNTVSLQKQGDGYLLEADNLSSIKATANNRSDDVEVFASTDEQKALICETNGKLDIRVDRDHNGTYETSVVGKADLKDASVDKIPAQSYTGSKVTPVPRVVLNGRELTNGTDYELSFKNNINAGTATVDIKGKGNYSGTVTKTFMILPGKTSRGDMFNLANNVKVTWKEVPGAKYYKVYREGITDAKESQKEPVIVTGGLVGWDSQSGLTNGHAYRYKIVASLTRKGDSSGDSKLSYSKVMYRLKTVVIRSVKNTAAGAVTVKYDKTTSGDSYVLQYSEREDMVGAKTKVVLGANNTTYTINGLKKGKIYYISIRVRKKVEGINYYTTFGVPKKVTITK